MVDTGFWLALANKRDSNHLLANEKLSGLQEPLITTWPVMTETCHLLLHRIGAHAQTSFIAGASEDWYRIFDLQTFHLQKVASLMDKYSNLPMDLADASLVILAEELGTGDILSTDQRNFETYRWKQHKPFNNLLLI